MGEVDLVYVALMNIGESALHGIFVLRARHVGVDVTGCCRRTLEAEDFGGFDLAAPEREFGLCLGRRASAVFVEAGGDDGGLLVMMVENDNAGVEAAEAVCKVEVIDRRAREFGLHKILQIVAEESKAAAEREGKINVVEEFVAGEKVLQLVPRIAKQRHMGAGRRGEFAAGAVGAKGQKRVRDEKGISSFGC